MLEFLSFLLSLYSFFRDLFSKRNPAVEPPFSMLSVDELVPNMPSPLRVTPERIERSFQQDVKPGMHIFLGTSGVGKTREATDFIQRLSRVSGAQKVFLAKGHIQSTAPLPKQKDIRRIIVMIDDYDFGFDQAASTSFFEREAAYREALVNLRDLYGRLKTQLELHAFVVTINQHRLPVCPSDINNILPECELTELPLVTPEEFSNFILVASKSLGVSVSDEALKLLVELCDGRFDSVATFLSSFDKGFEIQRTDIKKFSDNLKSIWLLFKDKLSDEQKHVYEKIKILKDFKLPPRVEYVKELLQLDCQYLKEKEVRRIITSIWPLINSRALIYDGQFGPPKQTLDLAKQTIFTVLKSARLRYSDRYVFQEETKAFASMLTEFPPTKIHLQMLRKLCKWYPHDHYIAYLLALAYASHGKQVLGIRVLYRILRQHPLEQMLFGKWIGIKSYILLADFLIRADKNSKRHWMRYKCIERQFKLATLLADEESPDLSVKDYGDPQSLDGTPVLDIDKVRQAFDNAHKELGYDVPATLSVDRKYLRAMVHHKYSHYLLGELQREYDALKHAEIVTKLLPEFGDAYINCAEACLRIGDTRRALAFAEKARLASPHHMNPVTYEYMIAKAKWTWFLDTGDIPSAEIWFNKCYELAQKKPLCDDTKLKASLEHYKYDTDVRKHAEQLASLRQKEFGEKLIYSIPSLNIELRLPPDWKIANEHFSGDILATIFAPQITWDEKAERPCDASICISYLTRQEEMALDAKAFGVMLLTSMKKMVKTEWSLVEEPKTFDEITVCSWNFRTESLWPKEGILMAFASPKYRMKIGVTCEVCGKHIFWPILTSVAEVFTQTLLHNPAWKFEGHISR